MLVEADEEVAVGERELAVALAVIGEEEARVDALVVAPRVRAEAVAKVVHPVALVLLEQEEKQNMQ